MGGVPGNALATTGTGISPANEFLSISELRAFGVAATSFTNLTGAPQILLDVRPLSLTQPAGFPFSYSVYVTGTQPISYQWKHDGVNLGDNGRISGSHSNILTFAETFASDSGNYQLIATNSAGSNSSSVASLTLTRVALNSGGGWTQSGVASIAKNAITLTDGNGGEVASSFLNWPVYVGAFEASWTYQDVGGGGADGAAFVLQNSASGPSALGGGGGGLGVSGISPSVELEFNLYTGNSQRVGYTLLANGLTGANGNNGNYQQPGGVNIASGDPIGVTLLYNGANLSLTLTDAVTSATFSTNLTANISALLGTNTAYVGFTGADGGVASRQVVTNFFLSSLLNISAQATGPNTILLSWPSMVGGFILQQNTSLTGGGWANVTNPISVVNGQNQVSVTPAAGNRFYRLTLP